jgi:DNA polymerase III delta prime subunit
MSDADDPKSKIDALIASIDADDSATADTPPDAPPRKRRWRPFAAQELPRLVLARALGPALVRRLRGKHPIAVVVQAPAADWVDPLQSAAKEMRGAPTVVARDGSNRSGHKPEAGNDEIANALRDGRHVIGISHAPDRLLPSALVAVADARVACSSPHGPTIRALLRRCLGSAPRDIADDVVSGLGYHDIVASFRHGATPHRVVALLAAASSTRCRTTATDDTPPLDALPGCDPAAREWGLALARDYAAWRRGDIPWKQVCSAAVLTGPPGTGKTTFAKALARTLKMKLTATSVGDWFATTPGHLDSVVKGALNAFEEARNAKGILFIDELDGIPNRNMLSDHGRDWWTPVITFLLLLFDSAQTSREGMILLGATNMDIRFLDPALVRPGRFGRHLVVGLPSAGALADILRFHLGGAAPNAADLEALARLRPGATGADAAQWARDAQAAAREARRDVTLDDLVAAVAPPDDMSYRDRRLAAVHEAGHVVVGVHLGRAIQSVSVVALGRTGGRTSLSVGLPAFWTRADVEAEVSVLLAGRAAEAVLLAAPSMAAEGDLMAATALVAQMHVSGGLGADLVHRAPSASATAPLALDPVLRRAVAVDLNRIQAGVLETVGKSKAAIVALADALVARRFLDGAEAEAIVKKALAPAPRRVPRRTP